MPKIRTVRESDIPDLLAIYAPYVLNTAITFEYEVPSVEETKRPCLNILIQCQRKKARFWDMPMLPPIMIGEPMIGQSKSQFTCIKKPKVKGQGVYSMTVWRKNQCLVVTYTSQLVLLYRMIGAFLFTERGAMNKQLISPKIGYKFGKWHDIVWMQKSLTPPDDMREQNSTRNQSR